MKIGSVRHKGLKRFIERDDARRLPADRIERVRNIITALMAAEKLDELEVLPGWRLHRLTGDRRGTWSVSLSGNWRITFAIDGDTIRNLDLEDYH